MFADLLNSINQSGLSDAEKMTSLNQFSQIGAIVANTAIAIGFSVSVIAMAVGFIQFAMAQGDVKVLAKARMAVYMAVGAVILSLLATAIRYVILKAAGTPEFVIEGTSI